MAIPDLPQKEKSTRKVVSIMKKLFSLMIAAALVVTMCAGEACARTSLKEHNKHNYLAEMIDAAVNGKTTRGRALAALRVEKQKLIGDSSPRVDFDDLLLLAKIIEKEAGCSWLSLEWKTMTGEVLVNRVASPEFPNSYYACVYQKGQYSGVNSRQFKRLLPCKESATAAANLMTGTRILNNPAVVFQANFKQGSGVHTKLVDKKLGTTYLCYSNNRKLYK